MSDEPFRSRGLVFFSRPTPPALRRGRIAFAALAVVAGGAVVWPVYPVFAGVFPMLAGLPLSLAWVVLWLLVVFAGLIGLFRLDERYDEGHRDPPPAAAPDGPTAGGR